MLLLYLINLQLSQQILKKNKIEKLPIVDDEGHLKGLITIKDIEKKIQYPNSAKDKKGRLLCGAAVGITGDLLDRVKALYEAKVDVIVLDSAHGHSKGVIEAVKKKKQLIQIFKSLRVMLLQQKVVEL